MPNFVDDIKLNNVLVMRKGAITTFAGGSQQKICIGENAGGNTDTGEIVIGYGAGSKLVNTSGDDKGRFNVVIGTRALMEATESDHCTIVGYQAGRFITTGKYITAIGEDALFNATTGIQNTAVGCRAQQNASTGSNNTSIGALSLYAEGKTMSGDYNTGVGAYAGTSLETGDNNTFVGYFANVSDGAVSNSTAIGANSQVYTNNQIRLGSTGVTLVDTYGDIKCLTANRGLILKSANGTNYKITVTDAGAVNVAAA